MLVLVAVAALSVSGQFEELTSGLRTRLESMPRNYSPEEERAYLNGEYARMGALYHIFNSPVQWLGDGPSKYTDPLTRAMVRGNVGHFFTFYSEVGLFGWLASVLIFATMALRPHGTSIRFSWAILLSFIAIQFMTFVNNSLNDISVIFIYSILLKSYSLPPLPVFVRQRVARASEMRILPSAAD
jgi:hypothetical protein